MGRPKVKHLFSCFPSILLFGLEVHRFFRPGPIVVTSAGSARSVNDERVLRPPERVLSLTDRAPRYAWKRVGTVSWREALYFEPGGIFGRSCHEVHGACDVRINLYPAAPFRLAKVLLAWTIVQAGWDSSLERQIGKEHHLRSGPTVTHPTRPTHPIEGVGTQRTVDIIV
jgi:hypothetical protein